jgi:protein-L-isoaspartate(D-aspartate) O-methyltransferase
MDRRGVLVATLACGLLAARSARAQQADEKADPYAAQRARMLDDIDALTRGTAMLTGRRRLHERVLAALQRVPRHRFVPPEIEAHAYENRPLPIGQGQTISQPFMVALMTDLIEPRPEHRVLEVGTGSGYHAAVLAETVGEVYTIEILAPLGERARALLSALGYRNIQTRIGDGYRGWPEAAPFDGIVVTAAPDHVPPALVEQLKPGGRLVIPVGSPGGEQQLLVIRKQADGNTITRRTIPVRFVPLTRER